MNRIKKLPKILLKLIKNNIFIYVKIKNYSNKKKDLFSKSLKIIDYKYKYNQLKNVRSMRTKFINL
jgi:hypothetical protein